MRRASRNQRGFTLLEVLVALVMTGLVVGVAFHLFGGAVLGHARADRLTMALLVAESRLAAVGVTEPLRRGSESGRTDDGFRWTTDIRPFRPPTARSTDAAPVRAFLVRVSVTGDRAGEWPVTLETLRLRPRGRDE